MNRNDPSSEIEKECFTPTELSRTSNIEFSILAKLIEYKVIVADSSCANLYSIAQLTRLQQVCSLLKDVELEASTVAFALILLERMEGLEIRLGRLQLALLHGQNSIIH